MAPTPNEEEAPLPPPCYLFETKATIPHVISSPISSPLQTKTNKKLPLNSLQIEERKSLTAIILLLIASAVIATASAAPSPATPTGYVNHTMGESTGWYFNTTSNTSFTNYSSWAASQIFNLDDYLVFNTENQMVIETQNAATYCNCLADDTLDDKTTFVWGDDSVDIKKTIAVPLVTKGAVYFFSAGGDGQQCQRGMAFAIDVKEGLGLPPLLAQPPPPRYTDPPTQSPPGTVRNTDSSENGMSRSGGGVTGGLLAVFAFVILVV